jgi:hypothetical protein
LTSGEGAKTARLDSRESIHRTRAGSPAGLRDHRLCSPWDVFLCVSSLDSCENVRAPLPIGAGRRCAAGPCSNQTTATEGSKQDTNSSRTYATGIRGQRLVGAAVERVDCTVPAHGEVDAASAQCLSDWPRPARVLETFQAPQMQWLQHEKNISSKHRYSTSTGVQDRGHQTESIEITTTASAVHLITTGPRTTTGGTHAHAS